MNLKQLIAKMDAIEAGILEEAFNIKTVQAAVGQIADEQQRATALAKMATDNKLPGLYDPVSGHYVSANGSISNTADKDTDYLLAQKGLVPKNANTSTFLGKIFGTSGDQYDTGLRGQSDKVVADQESEEFKRDRLAKLQTMMKDLMAMKPGASGVADAAKGAQSGSSLGKAINKVPNQAGNARAAAANESIEFKGSIARSLVESFGYEQKATQQDEGLGAVLGRAAPGVGAVLGAQDAADRWKKGDKVGAVLAGLSGAFSLVPGLGWIPALGFAAANMGRDYAKSKSDDAGQADAGGNAGQAGSPSGDEKLKKLQKIIGANPDGIMGPETKGKLQAWQQKQGITADGLPGPETYGKAGIKESAVEQYRRLVSRLEAIQEAETPAPAAAEVKPDAPDQQEASLADMITKAGGQFVEFPPGHEHEGKQVLVVKKDVGPIVDASTMEILDNTTLAPTGQTFDPKSAGLSESQLDEGLWDSIVKGAMALGKGAKNLFTAPGAIAKGATAVGPDGAKYTWHGAQWVNNATGRVATKQVAATLGKTTKGGAGGRAIAAIKRNPVKTGLATVGGAGALGYLSGAGASGQSASPSGNGGGNNSGAGGADSDKEEQGATCSPEMIAKIAEIRGVMGELADYEDPAVQQVLQNYQEKIDSLKCGDSAQGQGASPKAAPKSTWTGVDYDAEKKRELTPQQQAQNVLQPGMNK